MKTLDDLKREVCGNDVRTYEQSIMASTIDLLHAQGRIVPDGYVAVPLEPTTKQLDAAVAFALTVTLRKEYGWINYTKDLYKLMIAAARKDGV